jgi:PAS domain S-box-containing protein
LGIVVLAIALRVWLYPLIGALSGAFVLLAILGCAWIGGVIPSIIGQSMIWLAQWYWFSPPYTGPWRPTFTEIVFIVCYYLIGCTIGALSELRRRAQERARSGQAEALSQREQLRATLSCMADGVLVTDIAGRVILLNPAAEAMTGWSMSEARGCPLSAVLNIYREDGERIVDNPAERVLRDGQVLQAPLPLVMTTRTARQVPIAYSAAPIRDGDGQTTGAVVVFRDETERRRSEEALRIADQRKDEFLATLAHELRNPLAPICMGLQLLQRSASDADESREVYAMMMRQSQHMVRLIDDLMDVSRITRGKLDLRKCQVELSAIIQNAVDANKPLIDESQLVLSIQLPPAPIMLYADPNRLTQVFSNLLNNAAKFTPTGGRIDIVALQHGGEVEVSVSDTGIGIPEDKRESIFEMFSQIEAESAAAPTGLGLGLTLVRRLAEMHGGSVEVTSAGRNLGSKFRVRLPILPLVPRRSAFSSGGTTRSPVMMKRRVLIVDDNLDALESLSRVVKILGNETCQAKDGLEAVESAREFRPEIILMDIGMPNLDGYGAARRIRQEAWGRDVTLIATTGWGQDEDRRRSSEAGFDHHLVKPVDLELLQSLLAAPSKSPAVVPPAVAATGVN